MSKKPAAALSANLVAVKGAATPAADMPGRAVPAAAPAPAPVVAAVRPARAVPEPSVAAEAGGQPLNFRVSDTFRRDFKVYAAKHGLKLNELLRRGFEAYRRQNGE
jgi:hypothetical protein